MIRKGKQRVCIRAKGPYSGSPAFQDLQARGVLGVGSFGSVKLVVHRTTHVGYALKCVQKFGNQSHWTKSALRERRILKDIYGKQPFVLGCVEAYQDETMLYLLMPLALGGEFSRSLSKRGPLSHEETRFYAATVVSQLEFLHDKGIVYRDLKSENLMLDEHGYLMMIDFGCAKVLDSKDPRSDSVCGTPEYYAPEMVAGRDHGFGVDWWCLGILTYECLVGKDPFSRTANGEKPPPQLLKKRIAKCEYDWPSIKNLNPISSAKTLQVAKSFVSPLLRVEQHDRLGCKPMTEPDYSTGEMGVIKSEAAAVKAQTFFQQSEPSGDEYFAALLSRTMRPPFEPQVVRQPPNKKAETPAGWIMGDDDTEDWAPTKAEKRDFKLFSRAWAVPGPPPAPGDLDIEYTAHLAPEATEASSPPPKSEADCSTPGKLVSLPA